MTPTPLSLDGSALALDDVAAVARQARPVALSDDAAARIRAARAVIDRLAVGDEPVYGVNTGFGSLSRVRIEPADVIEVQRNLIRSHAAGVGEPLAADVVRAMLLILAASLARGRSGVRVETVQRILDLLNHDITPIVPSRGSVGASGDLAPLAHAALVLIGEGEAWVAAATGERKAGSAAMRAAGLKPITLQAKEGLALINGTHLMAALGSLVVHDVRRLCAASMAAASMAVDACRASDAPFDARLHEARGQAGQSTVAAAMRELLRGSQIIVDHKEHDPRVQDPYCLRCLPQVLGAALDAVHFAAGIVERELGGVTDNPLVFPETGEVVSGGNFHGMPLALALDTFTIAVAHIAGIAERRINWLLAASDSENPVNLHLSPQPGLHSGLMIAQYTAAACCNEIQTLATPASVANIPTSAGMEDYNSMGATSGHQARVAVDLATNVIAIELLVMAEAMEYQRPLRSGAGVEAVYEMVRSVVPRLTEDRPPAPDIAAIARLIREGAFAGPAEAY